jgi:Ca2+-binding EF-hand superfamily protein
MRVHLLVSFMVVSCLLAGSATAQEPGLFDRLDKNTDGKVAADEVEGDAKTIFERLLRTGDTDKDGALSKEEFAAAMKQRPKAEGAPGGDRPRLEGIFTRADTNSDGRLSREEAPERLRPFFDRIDADGDGGLNPEEFQTAMQRLADRAGAGGGPARPEFAVGAMVLKALDADGNGELSASEIADAAKALAKFDKNGDGKLDKEELLAQVPRPEARAEGRPDAEAFARRKKEADKNGDGKLSKDEAPERLQLIFDRIDTNSDGSLDSKELQAFLSRRPE